MSGFADYLTEDRRLVILRLLSETPGYSSNESILDAGLEAMGHAVSRDQVRTDLAWLAEQDLVSVETVRGVMVARITQRGADVAKGQAVVPGVKKPSPGA